ncbi:MAG: YkgJ family cysteine cluster protein [Candidatus Doudnabacteria bacterium]
MALEMTKEAFTRAVEERAKRSNFTRALYDTLDEYQAEERKITELPVACSRGCSHCCYQMVCVFPEEMQEITNHINRLASPARRSLREQAREILKKWQEWFKIHIRVAPRQVHDPIALARAWLWKPCPLLQQDGSCGVYEARPLVCRTTTSDIKCGTLAYGEKEHAEQAQLECEVWANNLQMDHSMSHGVSVVVPLHHYLSTKPHKL